MRDFAELGTPVRGVNWVRLHPGQTPTGEPSLLASMGQNNGGIFVLDIDLSSGRCRQFSVNTPAADYPSASMRSQRTGKLYVGSAWTGHLHCYDPAHPELGLKDLGAIDPEWTTFPTGIQEAPDGGLWIGAYPGASLTRFDPGTGAFKRFGRMDETEKYFYPLCGDDGTIVGQVKMIRFRLEAFDPKSGRHCPVGPVLDTPTDLTRRFKFFKGVDGLLYLDSDQGNFRLQGMSAIAVEKIPEPMTGIPAPYLNGYQAPVVMPGGVTAEFIDETENIFRTIRLTSNAGKRPRDITLDWTGGGTQLFLIHLGPDRRIYGSSYMPEHLFRCELDGAGMVDLGPCSLSVGDAHSMLNYGDGLMAIASYPAARVSLYDPKLPYRFGVGPGSNPLDLGSLDDGEIAYRPHTMAWVPPDDSKKPGRIWVGSVPNAGLASGTLAWYEPATGRRHTHHAVVPNASPNCLQWLPDIQQLLIGLGTEPGSGVRVQRDTGAFALWDVRGDKLAYAGDFGLADLADVGSFAPASGGRFYALTGRLSYLTVDYCATPAPTRLLLIDPIQRKVLQHAEVPPNLLKGLSMFSFDALRASEDGQIYLGMAGGVCRVKPGTCNVEVVWENPDDDITVVGPVVGRRFFFASRWKLRSVELPP